MLGVYVLFRGNFNNLKVSACLLFQTKSLRKSFRRLTFFYKESLDTHQPTVYLLYGAFVLVE